MEQRYERFGFVLARDFTYGVFALFVETLRFAGGEVTAADGLRMTGRC